MFATERNRICGELIRRAACWLAAALVGLALQGCTQKIDAAQTQSINGLVYKMYEREPFTGVVKGLPLYVVLQMSLQEIAISGAEGVCEREFKDGRLSGQTTCHSSSGTKVAQQEWKGGVKHGVERVWTADGSPKSEAHWKDGKRHGRHEIYNPQTKKLVVQAEYETGELAGRQKVWDPTGEHLLTDFVWKNGKQTGFRKHDTAEENFVDGELHGRVLRYKLKLSSPEIRAYGEAEALRVRVGAGGSFYGLYDPKVDREEIYENGVKVRETAAQPVSAAMPTAEACQEKWVAAHRRQVGADAPIRADQLDEWEAWCKEGKAPS